MTSDERVKRVAEAIDKAARTADGERPIISMSRAAIAASDATLEVTDAMRKVASKAVRQMLDLASDFKVGIKHDEIADAVLKDVFAAMRGDAK